MKNTILILISIMTLLVSSCGSKNNTEELNGVHKVVVKEVLQASAYTYLNVSENGVDQWIAVSKIDAKVGETYYYKDFMEMKYFESKDLERTFESVYFIQNLKTKLEGFQVSEQAQMPEGHAAIGGHEGKPSVSKADVAIEPVKGGITIAELFTNKEKYNGKKVIIRGKVVKTNFEIMDKNWFHIQDGTSADGKFDLTITSLEKEVNVDEILTFEGTVALNKDFGHGYSYEILLEDAVINK